MRKMFAIRNIKHKQRKKKGCIKLFHKFKRVKQICIQVKQFKIPTVISETSDSICLCIHIRIVYAKVEWKKEKNF